MATCTELDRLRLSHDQMDVDKILQGDEKGAENDIPSTSLQTMLHR